MPSVAFTVTVDAKSLIEDMKGLEKQIPYILARTLSNTAIGAEMAVRGTLPGKFTLRNTFTEKGIRYKAAQKNAAIVQAEVYTDTANRQTGAPDYLGRQETGGEKVPHNGRPHIAIPMKPLWELIGGKGHPIPAELRPKNLLMGSQFGGYVDSRTKRNKSGARMEGPKNLRPLKIVRGYVFYIPRWGTWHGNLYIWGRKEHTRNPVAPYYLLKPEVTVPPRLDMIPTVQSFVDAHFVEEWEKMWIKAAAKGIRI